MRTVDPDPDQALKKVKNTLNLKNLSPSSPLQYLTCHVMSSS